MHGIKTQCQSIQLYIFLTKENHWGDKNMQHRYFSIHGILAMHL